jgi:hypothetical protein
MVLIALGLYVLEQTESALASYGQAFSVKSDVTRATGSIQ